MSYSASPWTEVRQAFTILPCPSLSPWVCSNSCPLSQWCHPTISSLSPPSPLASIFPSIRVFSNESALRISKPRYWSFSFSISPAHEYSGLISFRTDWFDLAVQGTVNITEYWVESPLLYSRSLLKRKVKMLVAQLCPTLAILWTVACQAALYMKFSRQEYWSELPFHSPGDLPNPRIKPGSPALWADPLPSESL